jgi:hypothetical protein
MLIKLETYEKCILSSNSLTIFISVFYYFCYIWVHMYFMPCAGILITGLHGARWKVVSRCDYQSCVLLSVLSTAPQQPLHLGSLTPPAWGLGVGSDLCVWILYGPLVILLPTWKVVTHPVPSTQNSISYYNISHCFLPFLFYRILEEFGKEGINPFYCVWTGVWTQGLYLEPLYQLFLFLH